MLLRVRGVLDVADEVYEGGPPREALDEEVMSGAGSPGSPPPELVELASSGLRTQVSGQLATSGVGHPLA
eukprot:gene43867-16102_t